MGRLALAVAANRMPSQKIVQLYSMRSAIQERQYSVLPPNSVCNGSVRSFGLRLLLTLGHQSLLHQCHWKSPSECLPPAS
jgi:hypothetical protein